MIWVELIGRHREVAARFRAEGPEITIGRGYGNDVVLDDPHVAPAHLRIFRDADGTLVAQDLGSANGLFLDRGHERLTEIRLDGERPIRIGNSLLRIRTADFPVAPELSLVRPRRQWPLAVALGLAFVALTLLDTWLDLTREAKPIVYLAPFLPVAGLGAAWVGGWTVLARVFSGTARFERHLIVALAALVTVILLGQLADIAIFGFSLSTVAEYRYVLPWTVLGVAALAHLRVIGPGRMRLKAAGAFAIPALVIGYQAIGQNEQNPTVQPPGYVHRLLPPSFRLSAPATTDKFFNDAAGLKDRLDRARSDQAAEENVTGN